MAYKKSVPKMQVGRYAGTPVDKLPNSYLRWMMSQDFPKDILEVARRKLAQSKYNNDYLNVSRHALDMYSTRFLNRWLDSPERSSGFATFVTKAAQIAWEKGVDRSKHRHRDDGIVKEYEGIQWVFNVNSSFSDFKEVITVM